MAQGGRQSPGGSRPTRPKRLTTEAAKDRLLELLNEGVLIDAAMENIGYSRKSYYHWRRVDAAFKAKADQAQQLRQPGRTVRGERLPFDEFRRKYLKTETFWHQLQWVDLLEGKDPRDLHPAQIYEKGKRSRIVLNVPPFHAKSMTITVDYSVYRLCMDPSYRIIIVSETSTLAEDFLYAIKQRLTSPDYIELQKAYAPDGGWEATADQWTNSRIVFGGDQREGGEKDPNVQAIGIQSQIYGRRADLIVLDDAVTGKNVSAWAKQMTWLRREVASRLEMGGRLLVVGTRIASVDLYSQLMNPDNYANGRVPWTHFASPAILEEGLKPSDHVTLWPLADQPWVRGEDDECDCETDICRDGTEVDGKQLYPRWDGVHLEIGPRADNNNTEWALVYQQKSVAEDATFPEHAIKKATNGYRQPGLLKAGEPGYPYKGMHGMYVIAGLDPAIKGFAAIVVYAVDRETKKRYVLSAFNLKAPTKKQLEDKMKEVTRDFKVREWRVEKTGLLQFFTQDAALRLWFSSQGILFNEHLTGATKNDPGYGVSSLGPLFGEYDKAWDDPAGEWREITPPLIELPRAQNSDGLKALVHQLVIWTPELDPNKVACDLVMALWFAECAARDYLGHGVPGSVAALVRSNRFVSPRRRQGSTTVNLADYRAPGY